MWSCACHPSLRLALDEGREAPKLLLIAVTAEPRCGLLAFGEVCPLEGIKLGVDDLADLGGIGRLSGRERPGHATRVSQQQRLDRGDLRRVRGLEQLKPLQKGTGRAQRD